MWQNFWASVRKRRAWLAIALPAWVIMSFVLTQLVIYLAIIGLDAVGVKLDALNQSVFNTVTGVIIYGVTLGVVIGVPWLVGKHRTTLKDIGLHRFPHWVEIALPLAGFIVYVALSAALLYGAQYLPFINLGQPQDTGFGEIFSRYEYILAFFTLVVLAPLAEEILFRGYLFGKLMKHVPVWVAILITSILFGVAHGAWNVGIDVFALSVVLCLLRVISKSLWPSILLHMLKNAIAFFLLFIYPLSVGIVGL